MNETILSQIDQIWQIKQKLISNLNKIGGHGQEDVSHVSKKILMKTAMGGVFPNDIFDNNGYLVNSDDWSIEIAFYLASEENVVMTDAHWELINFMREYYEEYRVGPNSNRLLIKLISRKLGPEKGNKEYLYGLFPRSPVIQATKIAGTPYPIGGCV